MILWTLQPLFWWEKLQKEGSITGSLDLIEESMKDFYDDNLIPSYDWLVSKMKEKLPVQPPNPGAYPVWAWYQWWHVKKRVPDLRHYRFCPGGSQVRLKIEINNELVLLSDFITWHAVLNNEIIRPEPQTEEEWERIDIEIEGEDYSTEEKEDSWNVIFDLSYNGPIEEQQIQATFWELKLDQVKEVKQFTTVPVSNVRRNMLRRVKRHTEYKLF
jgi:hypothetical protein